MVLRQTTLTAPETCYERQKQGVRSKDLDAYLNSPVLIRNPASKLRNILRRGLVCF